VKLAKREADAEHWQIAMEQLIDAAEGRNFICTPELECCGR